MELTDNARKVLERRYLRRDEEGNVTESPEDLLTRVASIVAKAESNYGGDTNYWTGKFYDMMANLEFLPNSPTLMNAGNELGQLSGCFVVPVGDSMEGIFDAIKYAALIHKSGGGTGFSFSNLRPKGDSVKSTGGISSGPVSFMGVFSSATSVVTQGGKRHGANMGALSVYHPDIMEFVVCKEGGTVLSNFNISVAVDSEFMEAVKAERNYQLVNPRTGKPTGSLNAKEVFDRIVEMTWRNGDPGIVFIDRMNSDNPTPQLGRIESPNPCGEQPLLPFESCNLGSINLSKFVEDGHLNKDRLDDIVRAAVRFLDDVIDVNVFPIPEIGEKTRLTRKIGLGVMGFADMLIKLSVSYRSEKALELAENTMRWVNEVASEESTKLANERGVYPAYGGYGPERRNACVTTIAPTGSLSLIAGCSAGIEPLYATAFRRTGQTGIDMDEVSLLYLEEVEKGTDEATLGELFAAAHDIPPEQHVRMQAAFQKHIDNAVSKTINLRRAATVEDIAGAYLLAYELNCKGITAYRDGSREGQVFSTGESGDSKHYTPKERPTITVGQTEVAETGCGHLYVTINSDPRTGELCEVFATLGKAGGCAVAQLGVSCRLISIALRSGQAPESIIKHLKGIRCPNPHWHNGRNVLSCADAIGHMLKKYCQGNVAAISAGTEGPCPECSSMLVSEEGCLTCKSCGYTRC